MQRDTSSSGYGLWPVVAVLMGPQNQALVGSSVLTVLGTLEQLFFFWCTTNTLDEIDHDIRKFISVIRNL